jgi:hypothetical protein
VIQITAFMARLADHVDVIREDDMPPLTTPATAILFMVAFFVVMMGVPLLILRVAHHRSLYLLGSHRPHKLILPE